MDKGMTKNQKVNGCFSCVYGDIGILRNRETHEPIGDWHVLIC